MFLEGLQEKIKEIQTAVHIIVSGGSYMEGNQDKVVRGQMNMKQCEMPEEEEEEYDDELWNKQKSPITQT